MKFTESHEWVKLEGNTALVGITDFAQKELGEVVYVELPNTGVEIFKGDEVCVLESTKAASDVYSPISGKIIEVNNKLLDCSELINQSAEDSGWIFRVEISNPSELKELLNLEEYKNLFD